tara:strand:- start:29509 stop:29736 length:228 start_codon:yes stop_codon:yes gene_type:complete
MTILSGYKTYIVALLFMLIAFVEGGLGWDIPGVTVTETNPLAVLLGAFGLGSLRAGLAKSASGAVVDRILASISK